MNQDHNTECVLNRHKDGRLAIQSAPEVFLCTRGSIQDLINQHNARLDDAINATAQRDQIKRDYDEAREQHQRTIQQHHTHHEEAEKLTAELRRLEDELAKASRLQQTVTIAEQTIKDQSATIERLNARQHPESGPRRAPTPKDDTKDQTP